MGARTPGPGALLIVAAVAGLSALVGIPARATAAARTTADEPQYLLSALSLGTDGDLDIADELDTGAYRPFHEIPVDQQTRPLDGGRRISPHDPLLPLILAGPMRFGGWVAAKATLAVLAAVTGAATLWVASRCFGVRTRTGAVVAAGAFAGVPLAPYGSQVYPELPAGLALLVIAAAISVVAEAPACTATASAVTSTVGPAAPASRSAAAGGAGWGPWRPAAVAAGAVAVLPWLSIKYAPVAGAAALAATFALRRHRRLLGAGLGFWVLAAGTYAAGHLAIYGALTPYAAGDHFVETGQLSVVGTGIDPIGRSRRLIGLLVDRTFGIATWSPLWALLPAAVGAVIGEVVALVRRRGGQPMVPGRPGDPVRWPGPVSAPVLAAGLLAVVWSTATFVALTMHGWWVPGRQVVVGLPLAVCLIAALVERAPAPLATLAAGLGAAGAVNWWWLALESSTGRATLVVDLAGSTAPFHRLLALVGPDGMRAAPIDDVLLVVWAGVAGLLTVAGYRLGARGPGGTARAQRSSRMWGLRSKP
ncbi:MAG: hypothetical protein ACK5PP_15205 [Acidimicrobiales bacterium]